MNFSDINSLPDKFTIPDTTEKKKRTPYPTFEPNEIAQTLFVDRQGNTKWIDVKITKNNEDETYDLIVLQATKYGLNPTAIHVPQNKLRAKPKPPSDSKFKIGQIVETLFKDRNGSTIWIDVLINNARVGEVYDIEVLKCNIYGVNPNAVYVPGDKLREKGSTEGLIPLGFYNSKTDNVEVYEMHLMEHFSHSNLQPPSSCEVLVSGVISAPCDAVWDLIRHVDFSWNPEATCVIDKTQLVEIDTMRVVVYGGCTQTNVIRGLHSYDYGITYEMVASEPPVPYSGALYNIKLEPITVTKETFITFTTTYTNDATANVVGDQTFKLEACINHLQKLCTGEN